MTLYDRLAAQASDDDTVFESRGQHLLRQGQTGPALADFEKALSLKPQNPRLRDLVRSVHPQEEYATPYLKDAVALAKKAPARPPSGDDGLVTLAQVDVVRVYPNGLASRVHQEVLKIFNDQGVDRARVPGGVAGGVAARVTGRVA